VSVFSKWFKSLRTKASDYHKDYWKKLTLFRVSFRSKYPIILSVFGSNLLLFFTQKQAFVSSKDSKKCVQWIWVENFTFLFSIALPGYIIWKKLRSRKMQKRLRTRRFKDWTSAHRGSITELSLEKCKRQDEDDAAEHKKMSFSNI
jgi:hypothetical protein